MKYQILNQGNQNTYAVIMEDGDETIAALQRFANEQAISSAQFTAIGAFNKTVVGFYDFSRKDYDKIIFDEQTEVLSLSGDISHYQGNIQVHAHVVLGKQDGSAHGGHLLEGFVHPTLEVILTESPAWLAREMDERIGIPLIKAK